MYSFFYNPNMLIQSHNAFLILVIFRCFYTKRVPNEGPKNVSHSDIWRIPQSKI